MPQPGKIVPGTRTGRQLWPHRRRFEAGAGAPGHAFRQSILDIFGKYSMGIASMQSLGEEGHHAPAHNHGNIPWAARDSLDT
jgi:hypothetical protein